MSKILFHGTTYKNYLSILKNGFGGDENIWNCSDLEEMYFYDDSKDSEDYENKQELHNELITHAFESAQIAAAVQGDTDNKLIVLKLEVNESLVNDDYSCENMSDIASTVAIDDLSLDMIKEVFISKNYNPFFRFFYIANLYKNNDYLETYNFTDIEIEALEIIAQNEIFIEELINISWESFKEV